MRIAATVNGDGKINVEIGLASASGLSVEEATLVREALDHVIAAARDIGEIDSRLAENAAERERLETLRQIATQKQR